MIPTGLYINDPPKVDRQYSIFNRKYSIFLNNNEYPNALFPLREYTMTTALILMGGMGLIISAVLALASKIFYVYVDPKVEAVEGALPGAN
jgi:hypothetical protein